jgi:HPt (histidine-containing phosphotransfer) domain-containing protein
MVEAREKVETMPSEFDQFRDAFFEEAAEHVAAMEGALLRLEDRPDELELLHRIFRGAHSIKGGSGMLGFADLGRFTHLLESLLDRMRDGTVAVTPDLIDLLLRATDALKALLAAAKADLPAPATTEQVLLELNQSLGLHAMGTGPRPQLQSQARCFARGSTLSYCFATSAVLEKWLPCTPISHGCQLSRKWTRKVVIWRGPYTYTLTKLQMKSERSLPSYSIVVT